MAMCIEKRQHRVLDVAFGEDDRRIRVAHGPDNFARLLRIARNILQQDTSAESIRRPHNRAAWNEAKLFNLLQAEN